MEMGNDISRRGFLTAASSAMAGHFLGVTPAFGEKAIKRARPSQSNTRQNILFIFTDQERHFLQWPAKLSLPGHEKLARRGTTFASHYVSATMCTSSRAVMLTGLQTADNRMFDNTDCPYIPSLSPQIPNVGHMLRKAGYYTAYQGKWHLGREFGGHEFDKGLIARMDEYGFSDFFSPGDGMAHTLGGFQADEMIGASAISWLRRKGKPLSDEKRPWSLFVSLINPHDIMYFNADAPGERYQDNGTLLMNAARAPHHKAYESRWSLPIPSTLRQSMTEHGRPKAHAEYLKAWGYTLGNIPNENSNWSRFSDFYLNSLRRVDGQIALLLSELENLGLAEQTIVVFTSDHGEMGGNHGLRGKGPFVYEEAIHVPFTVIHPDIAGGQTCQALSSHIDLAPTLLALAGQTKDQVAESAGRQLPGKDLSPVISSPRTAPVHLAREQILFTYSGIATNDSEMIRLITTAKSAGKDPKTAIKESGYRPDLKKRGSVRCVFDGRYKFARYFAPTERHSPQDLTSLYQNNDVELYDLRSDPKETKNLAAERDKYQVVLSRMNELLEKTISDEMGKDDGREMPHFAGIDWNLERVDL